MTHRNVELLLGRLLTDERFRAEFVRNPETTLVALRDRGLDLNPTEIAALAATDADVWERLCDTLDPRLRKMALTAT